MGDETKCNAAFRNRILLSCNDALERRGFTRFRKNNLDWPMSDGFHCWISIPASIEVDSIELLLNVGVHVVPIEKLISTLDVGEFAAKYDRGVATYAIGVGELAEVADEFAFAFSPQQSEEFIASECDRLASIYATVGLDYAMSIGTYERLAPLLKERVHNLGGYPQSYAACLYLMGKTTEAKEFLLSFPKEDWDYIRGFAEPLIEKIDNEIL